MVRGVSGNMYTTRIAKNLDEGRNAGRAVLPSEGRHLMLEPLIRFASETQGCKVLTRAVFPEGESKRASLAWRGRTAPSKLEGSKEEEAGINQTLN